MTTRRSPDGQIYTEVPVVPRHDQLDGRSLGNSHPIEAITGLEEALDGKVDAVEGKGLSTEDFTTEEKEKLASYEPSPIKLIKVDGVTQEIDAEGAVDLTMYWEQMGRYITWDDATGKLALKNDWQMPLSLTTLPRDGVTAAAYDQATGRLVLTLHDGSTVYADLSSLKQEYAAGNGLRLTGRAFALADAVATAVSEASDHVATDSVHVSAADRSKWNGVDNAVKTSGDQSIAGAKTFTGAVVVPAPQAASQAATKAYVDAAVAGGGGGGGTYTAGTGLTLTGTEFSLSSDTQSTLSAVSGKASDDAVVKLTGNQTVAGVKTFSSSPVVPETPTADAQAASKKYVDTAAGAKADDSAVVKLSGAQTVAGVKTFSSLPVIPTTAPTQNGQAASKKYVDDSVSGKAVDAAVVHNTGNESIAGLKTFTSIPKIPTTTPTDNAQVASKAYVDAAVAGGGGGGTAYTAGTGLQLVGTEFSLDSATQTAVAAVSGKAADSAVVHNTGAETVAGVKTFSSSPVVPTPTTDYQVATKKYVDDNAGGGGGTWTTVGTDEFTTTTWNTLFSGTSGTVVALKDIMFYCRAYYGTSSNDSTYLSAYIPKGSSIIPGNVVGTSLTSSNRLTFNFRPNGLFEVLTSLPVMAIEKLASSATAWTVSYPTVAVTKVNEPYKALSSGYAAGKCTICVQYR